jgi:hypothetical protein
VHAIARGVLFIKCLELVDRGGFLVARSRQVRARGSTQAAGGAAGPGGGPVPASVLASPMRAPGAGGAADPWAAQQRAAAAAGGYGGGRGGGYGGGGGGGRGSSSALIGQELMVRSGPYARYKGRVKQETATHLQLELDAINRIVTIRKEDALGRPGQPGAAAAGTGYVPGRLPPPSSYGLAQPVGPPRTPAHVMQTPMHPSMGGATPLHPSRVRVWWRVAPACVCCCVGSGSRQGCCCAHAHAPCR